MITSPVSHDHTLVHQLRVIETQPVVTDTNGSSVASRIGNILHCPYKCIKGAVKYTYETINAYPRIASSISIVASVAYLALTVFSNTLSINRASALTIVAPFTLAAGLAAALASALVLVTLAVHDYKSLTNREASCPRAAEFILATSVITAVAVALALVDAATNDYKERTNHYSGYSIMAASTLIVPLVTMAALAAYNRRLYVTLGDDHTVVAEFALTAAWVTSFVSAWGWLTLGAYLILRIGKQADNNTF